VKVTDDESLTDQAAFEVAITNMNEAPTINAQTRAVSEINGAGTQVGAALVFSDPEGDSVEWSWTYTGTLFALGDNGQITLR